ncbi:MAG: amino acid adenylation domain-containing protein, partial [Acidobacteriota bacterium]
LTAMAEAPSTAVRELSMLDDADRRWLDQQSRTPALVERVGELPVWDGPPLVHAVVRHWAETTPEAIAIDAPHVGVSWSFAELTRRADRLADRLRDHLDAGREHRVALFLPRCPEMAVAVLATLQAGAAYLPLDPAHPAERLDYMLRDAGATLVLSLGKLAEALPAVDGVEVLDLATIDLDDDAPVSTDRPDAFVDGDSLAYVIYTSGSTGKPKGVMVPHRGVVDYLRWAAKAYGVEPGGRVPMHSPLGFDLTVTALLVPWSAGCGVRLVADGPGIDPLAETLTTRDFGDDAYALLKITPSHLDLLDATLGGDALGASVRTIVIGGEALAAESLSALRGGDAGVRLINEYGPTETVVGCCVHEVATDDPERGAVAIGRPLGQARLHVLDDTFEPTPPGVGGELYIGGPCVTRGYLARPSLTAERFVPDPFGETPGARMYRSGDRVRHRADGALVFLGRLDEQVKIRGYRIEPGEIASELLADERLREAAVIAREDVPGDRRLAAYAVPHDAVDGDDATTLISELLGGLRGNLPEYMVPSAIVLLDALPVTANGKLDHRALPAPEIDRSLLDTAFVAPRNETEEKLAEIWMAVLGLDQVGVHDRFFDLGGHSLLATQVMARVTEAFDLDLPLRTLFESPTIAGLADAILASEVDQVDDDLLEQLLADL